MKDDQITLKVTIKTPQIPNFVEIKNVRHGNLDEAIASNGKGLLVDVADLDNEAIERIGRQWTDALLKHADLRRTRPMEEKKNG